MTDKQIIIDGVDVSGCKYFCKFTTICRNENIGRVVRPRCKNVVDCYYKQLKRKEQECEELKEAIDGLLKIQYQLADSCNKYVQTLAEIKEIAKDNFYYLDCDYRWVLENILQKISEVKNV